MNESNKSFDTLNALKHSEPLAFLASLSLIIVAFIFPERLHLVAIYNDSLISGFMFIISFVFSIVYRLYKYVPQRYQYPIANKFLGFGVYFFLGVGIFFLLLVAYEFGKEQTQIFALVKIFFLLFVGVFLVYIIVMDIRKAIERHTRPFTLDTITLASFFYILILVIGVFFDSVMEFFHEQSNGTVLIVKFSLTYLAPLLAIIVNVTLAILTIDAWKNLATILKDKKAMIRLHSKRNMP